MLRTSSSLLRVLEEGEAILENAGGRICGCEV
jgi:hypothetical protein